MALEVGLESLERHITKATQRQPTCPVGPRVLILAITVVVELKIDRIVLINHPVAVEVEVQIIQQFITVTFSAQGAANYAWATAGIVVNVSRVANLPLVASRRPCRVVGDQGELLD